jgi:hypothetical protein
MDRRIPCLFLPALPERLTFRAPKPPTIGGIPIRSVHLRFRSGPTRKALCRFAWLMKGSVPSSSALRPSWHPTVSCQKIGCLSPEPNTNSSQRTLPSPPWCLQSSFPQQAPAERNAAPSLSRSATVQYARSFVRLPAPLSAFPNRNARPARRIPGDSAQMRERRKRPDCAARRDIAVTAPQRFAAQLSHPDSPHESPRCPGEVSGLQF